MFEFFTIDPEDIDGVVLGCRIFQKGHIKKTMMPNIPRIINRNEGMGQFIMTVHSSGVPQSGIHVSLRRRGQIVGSDVTTGEGKAYFKILFGSYSCAILDRDHKIRTFQFEFNRSGYELRVDLGD